MDHRHAVARLPAAPPLSGGRRFPGPRPALRSSGLTMPGDAGTEPALASVVERADRDTGPSPGTAPAPGRTPSRWALALRIASGVLFVPVLVLLARAGGIAFWSFVALEVTLGLIEFYRMMRRRGLNPFQPLGVASALGLLWVTYRP